MHPSSAPSVPKAESGMRSRSSKFMEGVDRTVPPQKIRLPPATTSQDQVEISITHAEMLSSFNWIQTHDTMPTIAVPGHPPRWIPRVPSHQLPSDKESFLQRTPVPLHPHAFEPLLTSLTICRPEFDLSDIDFVTQLHNLKQLFRFARGRWQDAFRIDIELIGTTIFMNRFGNDTILANGSHSDDSCGHVFQEHMTSYCADLRLMQANSHHRVIRYNLCGLQLVVQHEVDTYACNCHAECKQDSGQAYVEDEGQRKLKFSSCPDLDSSLRVLRHGSPHHLLDAPCIAEIKTRTVGSQNKNQDWVFSQLWFSHSSNMLFGYHKDRIFTKVTENPEDKSEALYQWQKRRREAIRTVTDIIKGVIHSIQSNPDGRWGASKKFALIRWSQEEKDCLMLRQLREDYHKNMLPLKGSDK